MSSRKQSISFALVAVMSLGLPAIAAAQDDPEGEGEPSAAEPTPGEDGSAPADADSSSLVRNPNKRRWGVGARLRYVFVPQGVLNLFLDHSTSMNSVGFGAEVVGRKGDFDIVFGLEYDGASPSDGLYQDKGDDAGNCDTNTDECPDYTEFDGLGVIALDASFIWHAKITDKIQFRYGAGIGIGIVTGTMYQTKRLCPGVTSNDDLDNPDACNGDIIEARHESEDVPPVVPIINVLLGARFAISEDISLNVETGFRDVFYLGMGADYFF